MRGGQSARLAGLALATLMLGAALGGCSSVSNLLDTSGSKSQASAGSAATPAASGSAAPAASGTPATTTAAATPASGAFDPDDYECPDVTVRGGAGTLMVGGKTTTGESSAMDLRYQGTFVRYSRECQVRPGTMTMKVGVIGRVITGPAGGPGEVDVPMRIAVVEEGPVPKTVVSKLVHIPVTVAPDTPSVEFTHIDPDVTFPLPKNPNAMGNYVVYIGFDPSASEQHKPKPAARKRR
jgi:hypothetical protein